MGLLTFFFVTMLGNATLCTAQSLINHDYPTRMLSRGEAVYMIVNAFNLKAGNRPFINDCLKSPGECFFAFVAMSDFDGISFTPLQLYPDVNPNNRYYEVINTATMLDLVHGYIYEENTPFKPEIVMTRIQALKVVLGAADLLKWKEKFELQVAENSFFNDIDPANENQWWYERYADFALQNDIVDKTDFFRPDDIITLGELNDMIARTLRYKSSL